MNKYAGVILMINSTRKILFLSGTRADFGKLKPLIQAIAEEKSFQYSIFVTGMHTLSRYGYTVDEVYKAGFRNIHVFMNQIIGEPMDLVLSNTIAGFSRYVNECHPDMVVVHGDRVEALAGAIVGALNNILVAHIEGGEISGTIDELIRHSVSKLSHLHFVANQEAADRLKQLGEDPGVIRVIGSPDIDLMLSSKLPSLDEVKQYYDITYDEYAVLIFHPVTTEPTVLREQAAEVVDAVLASGLNYIVIYPNNDSGCEDIFYAYKSLENNARFRIFPSIRFEYFLTLLKNAKFIIGNSSAGVREAPVYSVPGINIGNRQQGRVSHPGILNVKAERKSIMDAISRVDSLPRLDSSLQFGRGNSAQRFRKVLVEGETWNILPQKKFCDMVFPK